MNKLFVSLIGLLLLAAHLPAQMVVNSDTLYGNEWINYERPHFKVLVTTNGVHRVNQNVLTGAGANLSGVAGADFQLFYHGVEVPIFVSTNGNFGSGDFIEFYGKQNTGALDRFLYANPTEQINEPYSLFTDTSAYFLTWNAAAGQARLNPTANDLSNLPPAEPWFMHEKISSYSDQYYEGFVQNDLYEGRYVIGEGWSSGKSGNAGFTMNLPGINTAGPAAQFGASVFSFQGTHQLQIAVNGTTYYDEVFNSFRQNKYQFDIPLTNLTASTTVVVRGIRDDDFHSTGYLSMKYPRNFDFAGSGDFRFVLSGSPSPRYLEISNFNVTGGSPILYDLTNGLAITTQVEGGVVRVKLPASVTERELVLINRNNAIQVAGSAIVQTEFINYFEIQGDYIIISSDLLYNDGSGTNWVQAYADYRAATGFTPVIIEVQQLYDQFSYGINRHEQSFRNMAWFADKYWTDIPPKYLFVIGKARGATSTRKNPAANLPVEKVPTFDNGADNLLTASTGSDVPLLATGRLAAYTADEVRIYLSKVIAFEDNQNLPQTIQDKAWMKRIIHLGGGDPTIQAQIQNNLNNFKGIAENVSYGANVFSFFKTSTDPIQISQSALLDSLINDGSSLITFFGHSSPNSFDFNLDSPSSYENTDRYPMIFSLGCFTGNIFKKTKGLSEDFVIIEDKGAIAFLASTQLSAFGSLNAWGDRFYRNLSQTNYDKGIGDITKSVIQSLASANFETRRLNQFMALHGDPAIKLNTHKAPDYLVKGSKVSFQPSTITTQLDSFTINITVTNIGEAVPDSLRIFVQRELPDGTLVNAVNAKVKSPPFEKVYSFRLPVRSGSLGLNRFCISVDYANDIAEGPLPDAELNNQFCINKYVLSDDVLPVFPYEFSIISTSNTVLKASTASTIGMQLEYFMEIDTTELFNSPLKLSTSIVQAGGTLEWAPPLVFTDSTVYYWRVQVNPAQVPNTSGWKNRSFVYIQNESPGWNQSHYYQFIGDDFINMKLKSNREFSFIDDFLELSLDLSYPGVLLNDQIALYINGSKQYHFGFCGNVGVMNFAVFDPITGEPWINNPDGSGGIYESIECRPVVPNFAYRVTDSEGRAKAMNFLTNTVPDGFYILAYTFGDYQPEEWLQDSVNVGDPNLFSVLESLGSTQLRMNMGSAVPYSGFFLKGDPAFGQESFAISVSDELNSSYLLPGSWNNGYVESALIGPSAGWQSLHWGTSALDGMPENDEFSVDVFGFDGANNQTLIAGGIQANDTTLAFIDSDQFPYLKIRIHSSDPVNETSGQLDYWKVLFDEIPDVALRPEVFYSLDSDTIQQGKDLVLKMAVENISNANMDSLLMRYVITDAANNDIEIFQRLSPVIAGDTVIASLVLPTRNLVGANRIFIEANPNNDQPEKFHFNNIALIDAVVTRDILNPLLDVTFDGKHIIEGDIVSAKPFILITLKDENKYLELGDTSLFKVLMQYPGEASLRQVHFDGEIMTFFPANPGSLDLDNRATIELTPTFLADGIYQLFVQAEDASGNQSGDLDYKISFKVINEAAISNLLNYPNPFTTSTRFVFTLTGSDLPDFMKIQIMTVTGRVVREITMDELGAISIGNNITEYAWDGTDQYGDRLANGVYLYRVITQFNGQEMKKYQNNTNQYFREGIGKMYMMR